ncbi:hypothetical protein ABT186_01940 [Streptomyces sp. NPDC001634]|uniref:DUF6197 family protein n=1 Tax=Streptomyces sp. NPDC001634 TaxID=3154390 RepID=UPI0033202D59
MTTITAPAASPPTAAPVLDLSARLALTDALMAERCNMARLAIDVNTARIPAADPIPEITAPPKLTPTLSPCPYKTPLAAVLWRARIRLERDGWCTGHLRDDARGCLIGHIRAEASSRGQADDACSLLLEAIRRDFPTATTVPSWNDAQRDPRLPARYLERAAELAHAQLI